MSSIMRWFGLEPADTMASALDRNRGVGPGFDFIRIGLSTLIFYMHCQWLASAAPVAVGAGAGVEPIHMPTWPLHYHFDFQKSVHDMLVPMFFAVSGFLVTGSALRTRQVGTFLWFRILRLLPALVTEVTLSALVLGMIFTTLPLADYLTDHAFFTYFLNIVGEVHFHLPGVFKDGGVDIINVNLWTLPGEFYCYLITMIGMITTIVYRPTWLLILVAIATFVLIPLSIATGFGTPTVYKSYAELVYYFFMGVCFYHWRGSIPLRLPLFLTSIAVAFLLEGLGVSTTYIVPIFICYIILFIGMLAIPRIPLLQRGDYSYGIYLYGFPICQACLAVIPGLHGHSRLLFVTAFPSTLLFAALSWHSIEKPALKLKKVFARKIIPIEPKERTVEAHPSAVT